MSALLLAGVPVLLCPLHVEQARVARNVVRARAGCVVSPRASAAEIASAFTSVWTDAALQHGPAAFAAAHDGYEAGTVANDIAREIAVSLT